MKKIDITRHVSKKWLVVILLAALIEPAHYFLLIHYPLPGKTFMGYDSDEALNSGMMRSVELGFDNPWSPGEKIFYNGALGSSYPYLILGFLREMLGIDALVMNIIAKFFLLIALLFVLFKTMEAIMPRRHELAFAMFLLPLGLMSFGYVFGWLIGIERFMEGFSFEFSIINNIARVYYYVPLITAFSSLYFFSKGKKKETTLLLGLTFFFYPFFGFAFAGLLFLYSISGKNGSTLEKTKQTISEVWKVFAIAIVFLSPWVYARLWHPEYFILYNENSAWWRAHLVGIAGSYFFLLVIILLANISLAKKYWKFLAVAGTLTSVIMVSELKALGVPPFSSIGLPNIVVEFTEIFLLALFAIAWVVLDSNMDRRHKFIILFALAFFPLSILNPKYVFWQQYRMGYILHIPLAMLAALYFDQFAEKMKKFGLGKTAVYCLLGLVAITSFAAYNYRFQMADRWIGDVYFDVHDKDAMRFLDSQPTGIVMASDLTNYFVPTWSGQYALYHPAESQYLGGGPDRSDKKRDILLFYSGNLSSQHAKSIIDRYHVDYVFYGSNEQSIGSLNIDAYPFLEKIYDTDAKVYKVI